MRIKEAIVVEGKNDTLNLLKAVDAYTIETNGTHLSKQTLELIRQAQKTRGVIVFTDPDFPGDQIRTKVNQAVDGCKNAFLASKDARGKGKVGIEHASPETLRQALSHCVTVEQNKAETLSWQEFLALGLSGQSDSKQKRMRVTHRFHLGEANAKTCFKRLNMLEVTFEEIQEVLRNAHE